MRRGREGGYFRRRERERDMEENVLAEKQFPQRNVVCTSVFFLGGGREEVKKKVPGRTERKRERERKGVLTVLELML